MIEEKRIKRALISVYNKEGLEDILAMLNKEGVKFISTGGTQAYIRSLGYECRSVESFTNYPAILNGRVKTLHPRIFGAILASSDDVGHVAEMLHHRIKPIDLVIVDLYPFEKTVATSNSEDEIVEMIDIGGISLIRAAAKNFSDVAVVPSQQDYATLKAILKEQGAVTTREQRRCFADRAFSVSSSYDSAIDEWIRNKAK